MKHIAIVFIISLLSALSLSLVACNKPTPPPEPGPDPVVNVQIIKDGTDSNGYTIIYPDGKADERSRAMQINSLVYSIVGGDRSDYMPKADKQAEASAYEILIGDTNRDISKALAAEVNAKPEAFRWGIAVDGSSIALYAANNESWDMLLEAFTAYVKDDSLIVAGDLHRIETMSQEVYDQLQVELSNKRHAEEIFALQELIATLRKGNFYGSTKRYAWADVKDQVKKTTTEDKPGRYKVQYDSRDIIDMTSYLEKQSYDAPAPENCPIVGQHPRLLFTEEDIPAIKAAMNDPACAEAFKKLKSYIGQSYDGKLGDIVYIDPAAAKREGKSSISNYSEEGLAIIQGKAFYYAVTGELLYGYQAVYAMMNYLDTLDIGYFSSDQCRYFGHTAYTAALVYDWCYDLMSPELRELMTLGIQNTCFVGYSSLPDGATHSGLKSEVGFPPTSGTGPIEGHGAEFAILRDYLSVAIAIYDEHPDWYNLIGGRIFEQYVPIRNFYYSDAGIYPEGTACYAPFRFLADQFCAWMLQSSLGKSPFTKDMQKVTPSLAAHVTSPGGTIFSTGDWGGNPDTILYIGQIERNAVLSAFLHDDPYMRSLAQSYYARGGGTGCATVTATELIICASSQTECADDFRGGLDVISYNGGYYQQILIRSGWSNNDVTVLMRGASSSTTGHTHQASGEFQIYYKGMLSGSDGVYSTGWGSNHHMFYHKATIAHNCLLVFNPAMKTTDNGYYSGGQPMMSTSGDYQDFVSGRGYSTGIVRGVMYDHNPDGSAKYAYYDNDLSKGYAANRVDYVGRSMLTVMTGNADHPMILFIYDRIHVEKTDYTKSFLLQCVKEPTIDSETGVTTVDNGAGKLVLHPLLGCGSIHAYGGDSATDPDRYWISTQNKNLAAHHNPTCWGKVEIQTEAGNQKDALLNVLYVTDSDNDASLDVQLLRGEGYDGAVAGNHVAIFAFGEDQVAHSKQTIRFTTEGSEAINYYIGGLAAGTWNVTVGTTDLGPINVKQGEHMLVFSAQAGAVTITPVTTAD